MLYIIETVYSTSLQLVGKLFANDLFIGIFVGIILLPTLYGIYLSLLRGYRYICLLVRSMIKKIVRNVFKDEVCELKASKRELMLLIEEMRGDITSIKRDLRCLPK